MPVGEHVTTEAWADRWRVHALRAALRDVLAPLSFLVILSTILWRLEPSFLRVNNLQDIARQTAVVAILAVGQTVVIISGHIDLSVGFNLAFAGCVAGVAMRDYQAGAMTAAMLSCLSGAGVGVLNGLITAYGRIPAFIVTLGMMLTCRGMALIVAGNVNISGLAPGYELIGAGELFGSAKTAGIPYAFLIMIGAALLGQILLTRTQWGRYVYAVGGNREAARLSGLPMNRITVTVMAFSGLMAGLAAVVDVSRAGVAQPTAGQQMELWSIAATVIGGTSLFGGVGGIPGTILGAFLMSVIQNGCNLRGVEQGMQFIVVGTVIILAVLYDRLRRRQGA
ncbi:MAG: ABC transporter permease [Chloroherpetonaceae bacterium]|nr:ABC transporter permease [Chthonomonadaceae bacterium]MDW8208271.1 ABC transporter permease [Chloroherpetonaceae bacterium]